MIQVALLSHGNVVFVPVVSPACVGYSGQTVVVVGIADVVIGTAMVETVGDVAMVP